MSSTEIAREYVQHDLTPENGEPAQMITLPDFVHSASLRILEKSNLASKEHLTVFHNEQGSWSHGHTVTGSPVNLSKQDSYSLWPQYFPGLQAEVSSWDRIRLIPNYARHPKITMHSHPRVSEDIKSQIFEKWRINNPWLADFPEMYSERLSQLLKTIIALPSPADIEIGIGYPIPWQLIYSDGGISLMVVDPNTEDYNRQSRKLKSDKRFKEALGQYNASLWGSIRFTENFDELREDALANAARIFNISQEVLGTETPPGLIYHSSNTLSPQLRLVSL